MWKMLGLLSFMCVDAYLALAFAAGPHVCAFSIDDKKVGECILQGGNKCPPQKLTSTLNASCGTALDDLLCVFHSSPDWPSSADAGSARKAFSEKPGFQSVAWAQPGTGNLIALYRENATGPMFGVECKAIQTK
jgi:hypothetical protein